MDNEFQMILQTTPSTDISMWLLENKEAPAATAASDLAEQVSDPAFKRKKSDTGSN